MTTTITAITADDLHDALLGTDELALLDVREPAVVHASGTPLLAAVLPLGLIELRIDRFVPRRSTRIAVLDDDGAGDGLAARAGRRLEELGYTDVVLVGGGTAAWAAAGYELYEGTQVLGQAFGEFVEQQHGTPHLSAREVHDRIEAGERVVLLDSRPAPEFANHSLPGGVSAPGAELVYRATQAISSPDDLVVVNCAGRTRSILGAQALINSGVPNRVVALEGGTMTWSIAGYPLHHGEAHDAPRPDVPTAEEADQSRALAAQAGVGSVSLDELDTWRADDARTTYVLDIRPPEDYLVGHLAGSRSAPSWDVAPWVFRHLATLRSRLVLVDEPDGIRAAATALWLVQLGWPDVVVLDGGIGAIPAGRLEVGPEPVTVLGGAEVASVDAATLDAERSAGGAVVIDVGPSPQYREGHIPGAWFALRSRLGADLDRFADAGTVVLTSPDGVVARLAAAGLIAAGREVRVLAGGTAAWVEAGLRLEDDAEQRLHPDDDVAASPWAADDQHAAFQAYLTWEVALLDQLARDKTTPYRSLAEVTA